MELIGQSFRLEMSVNGVDAVGGDEGGAGRALGDEVAQRPADGAGHADVNAGCGDQGEVAVDAAHGRGVAGGDERRASSTVML